MGRDGCCPQEPGSARAFLRHSGFGRWVGALHTTSDRSLVFPRSCRRNNVFEFVSEHHPNFPGELLSKVSGENIFQDENVVVSVSAGRRSLPGCCGDGWPAGSAGHPRLPPGTWPRWVFCPTKEDRARPIYLQKPGGVIYYRLAGTGGNFSHVPGAGARHRLPLSQSCYSVSGICSEHFASGAAESLGV